MPKPAHGTHHKAAAWSLQIKSRREGWAGEGNPHCSDSMETRKEVPSRYPISLKPSPLHHPPGHRPMQTWRSSSERCERICGGYRQSVLFPSFSFWLGEQCFVVQERGFVLQGLPPFVQEAELRAWLYAGWKPHAACAEEEEGCLPFYPSQNLLWLIVSSSLSAPASPTAGRPLLPAFTSRCYPPPCLAPGGQRWSAPASPPQHLRCSKENICNCPTALWLFSKLSVHLKVTSQAREGSQEWKASGWQLSSTVPFRCQHQPTLPPRAGPAL